jgi:hypothetical protein
MVLTLPRRAAKRGSPSKGHLGRKGDPCGPDLVVVVDHDREGGHLIDQCWRQVNPRMLAVRHCDGLEGVFAFWDRGRGVSEHVMVLQWTDEKSHDSPFRPQVFPVVGIALSLVSSSALGAEHPWTHACFRDRPAQK